MTSRPTSPDASTAVALAPAAAVRHAVGNAALAGLQIPEDFLPVLEQVASGELDADVVARQLVRELGAAAGRH